MPRSVTTYTYDHFGNKTEQQDALGFVTKWGYDHLGRMTKRTLPGLQSESFEYDATSNLSRHVTFNAEAISFTYDTVGNRKTASLHNGIRIDWTYDALGRLTRTVTAGNGTGNPCLAGGTWNYTYDAVGNRLTETGTGSGSFSSASSYDANDRLTAVTGTKGATYDYDAAGNVVRHTETTLAGLPPLVTEYRWDAEGRMVGVTPKLIPPTAINPNPEQPKPIAYLYDAEGQLVGEVRDTVVGTQPPPEKVTYYLPDKNLPFSQIVEERDGTGALKAAYQFAGGMPLRQFKEGAASFYHADHLSVGVLTDATGAPQARYVYSPFGELVGNFSGTGTGVPAVGGTHLFAGERLNADSGLYYNRARWLDPKVARFASIDPHLGDEDTPLSLHDYLYAYADPVNVIDPSGLMGLGFFDFGAGGAISNALRAGHGANTIRRLAAKACQVGVMFARPFNRLSGKILKFTGFEAHHILKNADMMRYAERAGLLYSRFGAIAVPLFGGTSRPGSPHGLASAFQDKNRLSDPTFNQILKQAYDALRVAGCRNSDATELVDMARNAFTLHNKGLLF